MPIVSIFKTVADVENPSYEDFIKYLELTRDGEWQDLVIKCRTIKDKAERDAFKRTMPTTTLSGKFKYRKDDKLMEHSGYLNIDLDDLDNLNQVKRALEKDKYVVSCFQSTSGTGLRVIFKVDEGKHRESFLGITQYLYERYDQISDPNGISPSKPYVVSFDPGLYLNPDIDEVPVWNKFVKEKVFKRKDDFVHNAGDFEMILKQITGRGVNICESYQDWLKVGMAIASQFGEAGRQYFHDVSVQSLKYVFKKADKQYDYCLKAHGTKQANISSFYFLAKEAGVNIASEQTRTIIRATKNGKRAGLSKDKIIEGLKTTHNITNADNLVEGVFENDVIQEGEEDSILTQLEMFISDNYNLRMNDVTGFLEQNKIILSQSDLNTVFISAKKLIPKLDYQLMMRLLKSDFIEKYNPFFEFFGSDGTPTMLPAIPVDRQPGIETPLIEQISRSIVNDNPAYTLYFTRKWIVSIISAMHKVHSPLVHCLLGAQLTGKTEFYRRLLPPELNPYYAESKLDKGKDDEILMTQYILIMDDELGGKSKQDAQKLKNITSVQYYYLRRPYADHNEKILRLAVLCGTSNYLTVMNDPTGNRRIIPIEVTDINKDLYNSVDKKQLFMEAYNLYRAGFDWRINRSDMEFLNQDKHKYEMVIKERELIDKYFMPGELDWLSTTEILVEIEILTRQKLNINVIGRELKELGFIQKTIRENRYLTPKKWGVVRLNRPHISSDDKDDPKEKLPF